MKILLAIDGSEHSARTVDDNWVSSLADPAQRCACFPLSTKL